MYIIKKLSKGANVTFALMSSATEQEAQHATGGARHCPKSRVSPATEAEGAEGCQP